MVKIRGKRGEESRRDNDGGGAEGGTTTFSPIRMGRDTRRRRATPPYQHIGRRARASPPYQWRSESRGLRYRKAILLLDGAGRRWYDGGGCLKKDGRFGEIAAHKSGVSSDSAFGRMISGGHAGAWPSSLRFTAPKAFGVKSAARAVLGSVWEGGCTRSLPLGSAFGFPLRGTASRRSQRLGYIEECFYQTNPTEKCGSILK